MLQCLPLRPLASLNPESRGQLFTPIGQAKRLPAQQAEHSRPPVHFSWTKERMLRDLDIKQSHQSMFTPSSSLRFPAWDLMPCAHVGAVWDSS